MIFHSIEDNDDMFRNRTENRMAKNLTYNAFTEQAKRSFHVSMEFYRIRSYSSYRIVYSNVTFYRPQDRSGTDLGTREEHANYHTSKDQWGYQKRAKVAWKSAHRSYT